MKYRYNTDAEYHPRWNYERMLELLTQNLEQNNERGAEAVVKMFLKLPNPDRPVLIEVEP